MTKLVNKYDVLILLVLFCFLCVSVAIINLSYSGTQGGYARISTGGQTVDLSLAEDTPAFEIISANGINILEIKDGAARMVVADCPGGDCLRQRSANRVGQFIVCLPNGVVVEIIGTGRAGGVDAVTR